MLEYPRISLLLLVQAFLEPRTLSADGHHSEQIPVSNGLVAGSSQANHLTRALLHRALHDHHHRCPKLGVSQFVDDLKMYTEGTTRRCVQIQPTSRRAVPLSWLAQSRSVALKMWIRGHHTWHSPHCVFRLAGKGFRYFLNQTCKRFGCGCLLWSPFSSRCKEKSKTCIGESKAHSGFAKKHARANRLLFKGRALPQSTYGHQIWCIPATSMKRLRAAAA